MSAPAPPRLPFVLLGCAALATVAFAAVVLARPGWTGRSRGPEQPVEESVPVAAPPRAGATRSAGEPAAVATARAAADEVARLRAEVTDMRVTLEALRGQAGEPAQPPALRSPEAKAELERQRRAQLDGMEASFRREPGDRTWSADAAAAVERALRVDGAALDARAVECRSRTCRVELADDGSGKLSRALPLVALSLGATLPNLTVGHVADGGGGALAILYFTRDEPPAATP